MGLSKAQKASVVCIYAVSGRGERVVSYQECFSFIEKGDLKTTDGTRRKLFKGEHCIFFFYFFHLVFTTWYAIVST